MAKKAVVTKAHLTKMKNAMHAALAKATPTGAMSTPPIMKMLSLGGTGVQPKPKVIVIVSVTVIVVPDA